MMYCKDVDSGFFEWRKNVNKYTSARHCVICVFRTMIILLKPGHRIQVLTSLSHIYTGHLTNV